MWNLTILTLKSLLIDSLLCDNMQTKSQRHQSDSHISSSSHSTWSHTEFNDPLEENSSSADSLQTMQHEINDSASTIQGLDNELKQTEKKRDLLLKKHHLVSVQREIQVLQSQDVNKPLVDDSFDLKADYTSFISEHTQFIAFIKQSAENYLSTMMLKRNIHSEHLNIYTEKTVQKHLNFVCSAETVFHLMLKNFLKDEAKILYIMQFLMRKPQNAWYWHQKTVSFEDISWEYFINYLLNLVEDSMNCQLHNAQTYTEAEQKLSQSVHTFAAYLSTLKVQLMSYNEKQLIMHFFTRLRSEIRKILLNYQDLLNKQDSLIALTVQLKSNLHTPNTTELKKTFDDSHSRNTSDWAFSSIDWRLSEQTSLRQWGNINVTSSSSFFCSRTRLNAICYHCQEKGHYSSDCTKSMNNSNKIHIFSVTSLKKENITLRPQCWHNEKKK